MREKLKDPGFRAIEDFSASEGEDILALSDPAYYSDRSNDVKNTDLWYTIGVGSTTMYPSLLCSYSS